VFEEQAFDTIRFHEDPVNIGMAVFLHALIAELCYLLNDSSVSILHKLLSIDYLNYRLYVGN